MTTRILPCTCIHPYQDKEYGKGMRVFNRLSKDKKYSGYRCTVCGKTQIPTDKDETTMK